MKYGVKMIVPATAMLVVGTFILIWTFTGFPLSRVGVYLPVAAIIATAVFLSYMAWREAMRKRSEPLLEPLKSGEYRFRCKKCGVFSTLEVDRVLDEKLTSEMNQKVWDIYANCPKCGRRVPW